METEATTTERRRHARRKAPTTLSALVRTRNSIAECVVQDLSPGGALLGAPLDVDSIVEVVVYSPAEQPVRVLGRVVRRDGSASGVAFLHQGDEAEDVIQSILLRQLENERSLHP